VASNMWRCKICRAAIRAASTSNLKSHIQHVHSTVFACLCSYGDRRIDEALLAQLLKDGQRNQRKLDDMFSATHRAATERTLRQLIWFIMDGVPFRIADSPRFRQFLGTESSFAPASARTVLRFLGILRNTVDGIISKSFKGLPFVSVAVDSWSSATLETYLSISYQAYTDCFSLVTCQDIIPFRPPHTGENYRATIKARVDLRMPESTILTSICADGGAADIVGFYTALHI